jgi:hypothetical protein
MLTNDKFRITVFLDVLDGTKDFEENCVSIFRAEIRSLSRRRGRQQVPKIKLDAVYLP